MTTTAYDNDRLIPLREVLRITGTGRTKWFELVRRGQAPQPVRIGSRWTRWSEREVQSYVASLLATRESDSASNDRMAR